MPLVTSVGECVGPPGLASRLQLVAFSPTAELHRHLMETGQMLPDYDPKLFEENKELAGAKT